MGNDPGFVFLHPLSPWRTNLKPEVIPKWDRCKDKGFQGKTGRAEARIRQQGPFSSSYYYQVAAAKPAIAFLAVRKDIRLNVKPAFSIIALGLRWKGCSPIISPLADAFRLLSWHCLHAIILFPPRTRQQSFSLGQTLFHKLMRCCILMHCKVVDIYSTRWLIHRPNSDSAAKYNSDGVPAFYREDLQTFALTGWTSKLLGILLWC